MAAQLVLGAACQVSGFDQREETLEVFGIAADGSGRHQHHEAPPEPPEGLWDLRLACL